MKGVLILVVFFSVFTAASLLIDSPMFPGNFFCALMGSSVVGYVYFLSAIFNGAFYGVILWLVFICISKKLTEEK